MALIRQTIKQKKISFWKILIMVCGPIFVMDMVIGILSKYSPMISTIGGLGILLAAVVACILIIYKNVAYFNYKIIEDELIMEKVFGRANHLFLSLKLWELKQFNSYKDVEIKRKKAKIYKFVTGKNVDGWYVGEFIRDGETYIFIIEPNEKLLNGIMSFNPQV